jgi:hypothetical protein
MLLTRKTEVLGENSVTVPLCPPAFPSGSSSNMKRKIWMNTFIMVTLVA